MRHIETTPRGIHCFVFEHSKFYQKIQFEFLDAVESLNPQNIVVCAVFLPTLLIFVTMEADKVFYCQHNQSQKRTSLLWMWNCCFSQYLL